MKHNIFLSKSIDELNFDDYVGEGETVQEIIQIIHNYLDRRGIENNHYWRYLFCEEATMIDFGSWNRFIAIQPALTVEEVFQGSAE